MRNFTVTTAIALTLAITSFNPSCAEPIKVSGSQLVQGHKVNSYTNIGADRYRREMSSRGAFIRNKGRKKKEAIPSSESIARNIPIENAFKEGSGAKAKPRPLRYAKAVWEDGRKVYIPVKIDVADVIVKHARANNLDPLLVECVIRQESRFNHKAVSPVGAQGLMQLMPGTAAMLGCKNPMDPEENIKAGTRYLAWQLSKFKKVSLALAAYNAGPGAVQQYGGIPPYRETRHYVKTILNDYQRQLQRGR